MVEVGLQLDAVVVHRDDVIGIVGGVSEVADRDRGGHASLVGYKRGDRRQASTEHATPRGRDRERLDDAIELLSFHIRDSLSSMLGPGEIRPGTSKRFHTNLNAKKRRNRIRKDTAGR
jgi:hypothetical protein